EPDAADEAEGTAPAGDAVAVAVAAAPAPKAPARKAVRVRKADLPEGDDAPM
ncbi:MAG: hypothetical protein RJA10_792, partial [Pseudomonadota bacterium]